VNEKRFGGREGGVWGDDSKLAHTDDVSLTHLKRSLSVLIAIVLGLVVGLIGWRAFESGENGLIWLALGGVAIALGVVLVKNFPLGIVGLLWIAWLALKTPAVAQGQSGGGAQGLQVAHAGLSALVGLWIARLLFGVRQERCRHTLWLPASLHLLFGALATLSSILFVDENVLHYSKPTNPFVNLIDWLTRFLSLGGMVLVGANLTGRWVDRAGVALIGTGTLAFIAFLVRLPHPLYVEFVFILAVGPLTAIPLLGYGPAWLRWLSGAGALGVLGTLLLLGAEWVSGWSGAMIAMATVVWCLRRKLLWVGVAAFVLIVASRPAYFYEKFYSMNFYGGKFLKSRTASGGMFENDRSRMLLGAARYATEFPLGIGLGNYKAYSQYYGRPDVWNFTTFTSAHGTFAQTLSEAGWAGLFTLLWLMVASLRVVWLYWKRAAKLSTWRRVLLIGGFGGIVGNFCASFLGDYLFPTYHNGGMGSIGACVYTWFYIGLSLAIGRDEGLEDANAEPKKWVRKEAVIHRALGTSR
jgi:hypothetical protein